LLVFNHDTADPEQSLTNVMNPVLSLLAVVEKEAGRKNLQRMTLISPIIKKWLIRISRGL